MDADHLRNLATAVLARRARTARALALALAADERLAQLAFGVRINRVVDRLVRHMQFGVLGPHAAQRLRDLLRRPQPPQHVRHQRPQRPGRVKPRSRPRCNAALSAQTLRGARRIANGTGIAPELSAHGRRTATQNRSNRPSAASLLVQRCQRHYNVTANDLIQALDQAGRLRRRGHRCGLV